MSGTFASHKHYVNPKGAARSGTHLSLFISQGLLQFAVTNADNSELLELCEVKLSESSIHNYEGLESKVGAAVNNYLPGRKFSHTTISVLNTSFTILPEAYAMDGSSKALLGFSSGREPVNTFSHKLGHLNFSYSIDASLLQMLERTFKNASIRHAGAVAINLLFNNASLKKCDVLLNFNEGVFELCARRNNELLYYNVFEYETKEDVLYYLLFMMEQFGFDPEKVQLSIAGQMQVGSDYHTLIKKYIRHISFAVNSSSLKNTAEGVPDHYYFTLLNQHLCEL